MKHIDYSNLRLGEVARRLRAHGRQIPEDVIAPLLLRQAVATPLYKTSLKDPVDAIVELICKIVPNTPSVAELERRVQAADSEAMLQLFVCYEHGIRGVGRDVIKSNALLESASQADHTRAAALWVDQFRCNCTRDSPRCLSVSYNLDAKMAVDKYGILNFANRALWIELKNATADNYVCPISLLMAGQAAVNPMLFKDNTTYTNDIKRFIERHPEAVTYYLRCVRVPCCHSSCELGSCEPGVVYHCERCDDTFCSDMCVNRHKCKRNVIVSPPRSTPKHNKLTRSYLEQILGMFGIYCSPCTPEDVELDNQLHASLSMKEDCDSLPLNVLIHRACAETNVYNAIRLYSAAISKVSERDKRSSAMAVLLMRRAHCWHLLGNRRGVADDCGDVAEHFDRNVLPPALYTECIEQRRQSSMEIIDESATRYNSVIVADLRVGAYSSSVTSSSLINDLEHIPCKSAFDYQMLNVDEIVRRLALKGRTVPPSAIIPLILNDVVTIPLCKTSLKDPIDAIVELICKIVPDTQSMPHLYALVVQQADAYAMLQYAVCFKYGINSLPIDDKICANVVSFAANDLNDSRAIAMVLNKARIALSPSIITAQTRCLLFDECLMHDTRASHGSPWKYCARVNSTVLWR